MNKKSILVLVLSPCFLISCSNTSSISTITSSIPTSSQTSESSISSDSSSSKPIKKELNVDNVYNDLLSLSSTFNFTIYYSDFLEDIYTDDYVLLNSSSTFYFKSNSIYQSASKGVYKAYKSGTSYKLGGLVEGIDEDGYPSDKPLADFNNINYFTYMLKDGYGASKSQLSLSSAGDQITLDYDYSNKMFIILARMFNQVENISNQTVNHISITYDNENNLVVDFSYVDGNTITRPKGFSYGVIKNVGTSFDEDASSFSKSIANKLNTKSFDYYSTYSIRNAYISTNTTQTIKYEGEETSDVVGNYQLDYNPNKIRISDTKSNTFIRRTESGSAYIQGINALNQVYDQTYYAQTFQTLNFGYKNFDFEGFRYDNDEQAYVYYGLNGGKTLDSITFLGFSALSFESIKLYVSEESNLINKIVAKTPSSLINTGTSYKNAYYEYTIDIVDYRTIGEPTKYDVISSTSKIQTVFNKLNDYENTSFKTVANEYYQGKDTKVLQPVLTTYYTQDYVYKETKTVSKSGTAYVTTTTGSGIYAIKDSDGNTIGVKLFRVDKDGNVSPRSQILYGKTLKDYWINLTASPLVYQLKDNLITPREGMSGDKLKNYLPISHTRFEAQEGSMENGGEYSGMTFTLKKDGDNLTDEVTTFSYNYGTSEIFGDELAGKGETTFTYSSKQNPIKISEDISSKLPTLGTFTLPTKWSQSESSSLYQALQSFYEGKKNRYGQDIDVDRDIPFLFDDDLDASWKVSLSKNIQNPSLNINHDVNDIMNDGDINNYNSKYRTLLNSNDDYVYTSADPESAFTTLHYYVNGDIVISVTSTAAGGIYFYQSIPQY